MNIHKLTGDQVWMKLDQVWMKLYLTMSSNPHLSLDQSRFACVFSKILCIESYFLIFNRKNQTDENILPNLIISQILVGNSRSGLTLI